MIPIYNKEGIILYHGNCFDILPTIKQKVDLLIADPPYGQNYQSNHRLISLKQLTGDDGTFNTSLLIRECCKLLNRGRHVYIFGPDSLDDTPLTVSTQLIWDKMIIGMGNLHSPWGTTHEPITFATYEPSAANRAKGYGKLAARMRKKSVISCQRPQGGATGRHPTEKPVLLLRQLIESSSVIDETILDPCCGIGSTLVAAILEKRSAIGIEIDPEYCEISINRIEKAQNMIKEADYI